MDFTNVGDMAVFIDDQQLSSLEKRMQERGYLDAHDMAKSFNMLRANDLIWSFVVNNYLLGKEPMPLDLLYWNADATRMAAAMHSFYLRNMYQENRLVMPGGITLAGMPIDLRLVETPTFILATLEDHIAPWRSTYAATQIYSGPVQFFLAASGHIAEVVSPPGSEYGHWRNEHLPEKAQSGSTRRRRTRALGGQVGTGGYLISPVEVFPREYPVPEPWKRLKTRLERTFEFARLNRISIGCG